MDVAFFCGSALGTVRDARVRERVYFLARLTFLVVSRTKEKGLTF